MRIPSPLIPLFELGVIDEVLRPLMSGKEASVYLVLSQGERRVAKVYKDATSRSFRQRAEYAEGRSVRNSRQRRAMAKGTRYGKALLEKAWQNAEVDALYRLHAAGVRVPEPIHFSDDVLVMELIADARGEPAPRLFDVRPTYDEAVALHDHLVRQVVLMLCAGMVHADLSEYNILMSADGPVIIDLPQATDAAGNRNSHKLLTRDLKNLAMFLGRFAPSLKRTRFGPEIWDLYERGELRPDSPLTGRWSDKGRRADAESVIAEIQAAAAEASERPVSSYRAKKARQVAEAVEAAEHAARRAEQAARRSEPSRRSDLPPRGRPDRPPREVAGAPAREAAGAPAEEGGGKKRRRRRRRRSGGGAEPPGRDS